MTDQKIRKYNKKYIIGATVIALILLFCTLFCIYSQQPTTNGTEDTPETSFGDQTLGGKFKANIKLISDNGEIIDPSITAQASVPQDIFTDQFDAGDMSEWDSYTADTDLLDVIDNRSYTGDYAAYINSSAASESVYMSLEDAFDISSDEKLHMYFFTYLETNTTGEIGDGHISAAFNFNGGKTLIYQAIGDASGYYQTNENTVIIDSQPYDNEDDMYDAWTGLELENIQDDYFVQFGEQMPSGGNMSLEIGGFNSTVASFIDEVRLRKVPVTTNGMYWQHEGVKVSSYFADIDYMVNISSDKVNESNVYLEIKLWRNIYHENESIALGKGFMQSQILQVQTFEEWVNWSSKSFSLPKDGDVYAPKLNYTFDIMVRAYGQIREDFEVSEEAGTWVSANASKEDFDSFFVRWMDYEDYIDVIIGSVSVTAIGIIGIGFVAAYSKKKKGDNPDDTDCDCIGEPNCWCDPQ